jgi:hypothetical protein
MLSLRTASDSRQGAVSGLRAQVWSMPFPECYAFGAEVSLMKYTRIYADPEGESHLQDVDQEMKPTDHASTMSELIAAKGVIFRESRSGEYFVDWHNAPRRQFVVNLTGEVEIQTSDGEVRRFGHGSILLAEDLSGKGHISRGVGSAKREVLFIPLSDPK